jgi:hypothetical protein
MRSSRWFTRSTSTLVQWPWRADQPPQAEQAQAIGLMPGTKHSHTYASRPFVCMGYAIQPVLHCDLTAESNGLLLRIHEVSLHGLGALERWVKLQGRIQLCTDHQAITVDQWLQISLAQRGPLAWAPISTLGGLAERLLAEAHQRMQRTLRRRLSSLEHPHAATDATGALGPG